MTFELSNTINNNNIAYSIASNNNIIVVINKTLTQAYTYYLVNDVWVLQNQILSIDIPNTYESFGHNATISSNNILAIAGSKLITGVSNLVIFIYDKVNNLWQLRQELLVGEYYLNKEVSMNFSIDGSLLYTYRPNQNVNNQFMYVYESINNFYTYSGSQSLNYQISGYGDGVFANSDFIIYGDYNGQLTYTPIRYKILSSGITGNLIYDDSLTNQYSQKIVFYNNLLLVSYSTTRNSSIASKVIIFKYHNNQFEYYESIDIFHWDFFITQNKICILTYDTETDNAILIYNDIYRLISQLETSSDLEFNTTSNFYYINGKVTENNVALANKIVIAYNRETGEYLEHTTSDENGDYYIPLQNNNMTYVICLHNETHNALIIDRVNPNLNIE